MTLLFYKICRHHQFKSSRILLFCDLDTPIFSSLRDGDLDRSNLGMVPHFLGEGNDGEDIFFVACREQLISAVYLPHTGDVLCLATSSLDPFFKLKRVHLGVEHTNLHTIQTFSSR